MSPPKTPEPKKKKDGRPSSTSITRANVYAMDMNNTVRSQLGGAVGTPYCDVKMGDHTYRIRERDGKYHVGMLVDKNHDKNAIIDSSEVTQLGVSDEVADKVLAIYKKMKRPKK